MPPVKSQPDAIQAAQIEWRAQQPFAATFDDIYFSPDGVDEVRRVFLEPCDILTKATNATHLNILELGFGTGLNFVVTAQALLAKTTTNLHFISCEAHPLSQEDWHKAVDAHVSNLPLYSELIQNPLPVMPGWHRRVLAQGRITLSVFHGLAIDALDDLCAHQPAPFDACYLDGFAPTKNPQMWQPDLLSKIAQCSHRKTTLATFTASGQVRRSLQAVGFCMRKVDQRPHKRESLAGVFEAKGVKEPILAHAKVTVHGAGIGGVLVAHHLAHQGINVTVADPGGIASGASKIEAALMHARLLADNSADAHFRAAAFHYATNYFALGKWATADATLRHSGVLQILGPNLDAGKLLKIATVYRATDPTQAYWINSISATLASELCGSVMQDSALWFPTAKVVDLHMLCRNLMLHPKINFEQRILPVSDDHPNIICAGNATRSFTHCNFLEIAEVHGQLDWFHHQPNTQVPVVGNSLWIPNKNSVVMGATYEYQPWCEQDATQHNLEANQQLASKQLQWQKSQRGVRAVSSDRSPIVGKVAENLWVATAHGSMGTTSAPLAGAIICSSLLGWIPPTQQSVIELLDPMRFKRRQLRRGVRHS